MVKWTSKNSVTLREAGVHEKCNGGQICDKVVCCWICERYSECNIRCNMGAACLSNQLEKRINPYFWRIMIDKTIIAEILAGELRGDIKNVDNGVGVMFHRSQIDLNWDPSKLEDKYLYAWRSRIPGELQGLEIGEIVKAYMWRNLDKGLKYFILVDSAHVNYGKHGNGILYTFKKIDFLED